MMVLVVFLLKLPFADVLCRSIDVVIFLRLDGFRDGSLSDDDNEEHGLWWCFRWFLWKDSDGDVFLRSSTLSRLFLFFLRLFDRYSTSSSS